MCDDASKQGMDWIGVYACSVCVRSTLLAAYMHGDDILYASCEIRIRIVYRYSFTKDFGHVFRVVLEEK